MFPKEERSMKTNNRMLTPAEAEGEAQTALEQQRVKIASRLEAIAEATRMNLADQVAIHREKRKLQNNELEAIEAGYERVSFENDMPGCTLDEFQWAIPLDVLKAVSKARHLFEDIQIWEEHEVHGDTLIVGQRVVGDRKTPFLIARW